MHIIYHTYIYYIKSRKGVNGVELVQVNRQQEIECEVIPFRRCKKLKKNGDPKMTPCNAKENRDNVYPFKEDDIPKMLNYLNEKIKNKTNDEDDLINRRNKALYKTGINIGLRCGDLVSLRWNDIYDENWNFLDGKKIKPIKTRKKDKHVLLKFNDAFKEAIAEYKEYCKPKNLNGYIFKSREGGHIEVQTAGGMIKKTAAQVGIKYNVNSHSLRKTFARVRYDHSLDKSKTLVELMRIFNHASPRITLDYICIGEEELEKLYNDVNLGLEFCEIPDCN
jgi:integrase